MMVTGTIEIVDEGHVSPRIWNAWSGFGAHHP